jgi:hypothetical protein
LHEGFVTVIRNYGCTHHTFRLTITANQPHELYVRVQPSLMSTQWDIKSETYEFRVKLFFMEEYNHKKKKRTHWSICRQWGYWTGWAIFLNFFVIAVESLSKARSNWGWTVDLIQLGIFLEHTCILTK